MSLKIKFKTRVIAGMKKKIEQTLSDFRTQQEEALEIHGELIADEAERQLERKHLDPNGEIADKIVVKVEERGEMIDMAVVVEDETAYAKEVGPEGGFLMVAAELTKGEAERKIAEHLREKLGG